MMELWTTTTVECAHSSPAMGFPQVHGHSYWLQFFCETSTTNPEPLEGMQRAAERIKAFLDHRNLDDIMQPSTMETLVYSILSNWKGPRLSRVIVRRDSIGCGVEWRA